MTNQPQTPQIVYQLAEPEESSSVPEVHLWDYVQIVLQRLPLALMVGAAVMLLAAVYTWTRTPRYTSRARLLVDVNKVNLTDMKGAIDSVAGGLGKREYMQTQVRLIKMRPVMEAVITKLNLMDDKSFASAKDPVAKLQNMISVSLERNTHIINVSVEREDPKEAQRILQAVISAYLEANRSRRLGVSEEGLTELRKKSDMLRAKLEKANDKLQQFMVENDMASFEKTQNVVIDRLRDLSEALTALQPKRMALEASIQEADKVLKGGGDITAIPAVNSAPIVKELKMELSKLGNEYSQLVERLGENHPKLQSISTQIQSLQTKLALEANAIVKSLRMKYEQSLTEEKMLQGSIKEQQKKVYDFNRLKIRYDALQREIKSIEEPYATISLRIQQIDVNRLGGQGEDVFVVSPPSLPKIKSWPSKGKNMMVAFILASGLAVGLCFFLDYMDTTVKSEGDIRRLLNKNVLAHIPNISEKGEKISSDLAVYENPRSHTAEAFRTLRTALTFSLHGERIKSVVVSSSLPSEGKSLAAVNLAITQAMSNKRTVLVDADMRKPRLHKIFGNDNKHGLSDLLGSDKTKIEDMVVATGVERLDFIPCGPIPRNPAELLESDRFRAIIEQLMASYDFVIFDSPPGFALVDSLIIGKYTDGLIIVVRSFSTPKAAAQQFVTRLDEADVRILGVLLNNADVPHTSYGAYYYGRDRNKYYRDEDTVS